MGKGIRGWRFIEISALTGCTSRFLRARRFVAADALILFCDSEKWRKDEKIDEVYDHFDVDEYEQCRKLVISLFIPIVFGLL